ncbi:LAMI_0B08394g1_1 [Lachancea mirantina]|uniref:Phosphoinositide phospholipase C n=1 Tax=Lachancea mirantina TaxID=1230905 RepID=A0A1G4IXT9_9SACH|nr:LAMI_0B08394g1_1 [Lachancea mirantina]
MTTLESASKKPQFARVEGSSLGDTPEVGPTGSSFPSMDPQREGKLKYLIRKTGNLVPSLKTCSKIPETFGTLARSRSFSILHEQGPLEGNDSTSHDAVDAETLKELRRGIYLTKVTRRKCMCYLFTVRPGQLRWKETKFIDLDAIKDIRTGVMAGNYMEEYDIPLGLADRWVTIIYNQSQKLKALHLLAASPDSFVRFCNALYHEVNSRKDFMESIALPYNEQFAKLHWRDKTSDRAQNEDTEVLTFEDVKELCSKFNIFCSTDHLKRIFDQADVNHNGLLNFGEFQTFVKLLKKREEVRRLWKSLIGDEEFMTFKQFAQFCREEQKEANDDLELHSMFNKYALPNNKMGESGFLKFLTKQPHFEPTYQDYDQPLTNYFICSSHNTYLVGKQVGGNPSVENYIYALQHGCRCIEVDVWDGDDGPLVCHGKLTGSINFRDVAEVIRKYAFITTPYPLIVSLEIHCKKDNQELLLLSIQELLGDKLWIGSHNEEFPSPNALKHKIILKVKKTVNSQSGNSDSTLAMSSSTSSSYDSELDTQSGAGFRRSGVRKLKVRKRVRVVDGLLGISLVHGLKFRNFSLPESKTATHCFSFSEKKFDYLAKDQLQKLTINKHNRRFMMRVYPHAFRYNSTNFDPIRFWKSGVQMVATNWQTHDMGQRLNRSLFQLPMTPDALWCSGYVLKPEYLLRSVNKVRDVQELYSHEKPYVHVNVQILSAQLLPKPRDPAARQSDFSPQVSLMFISDPPIQPLDVKNGMLLSDREGVTFRCRENGFNPIWETNFDLVVTNTGFNFLVFTVRAGDVDLANCCLKLDYLKQGYRHIPLYNLSGDQYMFSTLFIRLHYKQHY